MGFFTRERPELTPELDVASCVRSQNQFHDDLGVDCLSVEGGCTRAQVARQTRGRQLTAYEKFLLPLRRAGVESLQIPAESTEQESRPERAGIRFRPLAKKALTVDETAPATDLGNVSEARQLGHHPTDGAMGDSGGNRDLTVGAINKLGPSEQSEENLQACCLEGAAACGDGLLSLWALPLDEDQEGRLVQKGVTRGIDELDACCP